MRIAVALWLSLLIFPAVAQEGWAAGPNPPCSAFGTTAGTCAQGGVITAGGPTGSATVAPIITYNAAGQLTTVTSATITPAVGSITGLGTNVATALGNTAGGSGGFALESSLASYCALAGGSGCVLTGTETINLNTGSLQAAQTGTVLQ